MQTNNKFNDEEWQNRLDLAAAYHLADIYGFSDIIWNHITYKTSSKKNTFFFFNNILDALKRTLLLKTFFATTQFYYESVFISR